MNEITKPGTPAPQTAVSTAPSKESFRRLAECQNLQQAFQTREMAERINDAIPKHMDGAAMLRAFTQAASKTPLIYECDLRQSLGAFLSLSYLGLVPGTALQHVHLIPFRGKKWNRLTRKLEPCVDLNVIIGYPGYVELIHRSGVVSSIHADVVLPGEHFRAEHGTHKILEHRPELDHDTDGLTPRCAYAFVNMTSDGDQFEVMPWFDILKVRNRSQAFRTALAAKEEAEAEGKRVPKAWTEAPWVKDEREMGKKTPFRRIAKWLPKCPELRAATALEDAQDRGRLNYGSVIDGQASPLDGIPEAEDDPPPVDPGTAHAIRGSAANTTQTNAPDKAALAAEQAAAAKRAADARKSPASDEPPSDDRFGPPAGGAIDALRKNEPVKPPPATVAPTVTPTSQPSEDRDFEAVLVGADGSLVGDETFFEPAKFARAFMDLWNDSGKDSELVREYNTDALDLAMSDPIAMEILAAMDDDENVVDAVAIPTVEVPMERGKPSWPGYVKAIKDALGRLNAHSFPGWTFAQRETLERCPMGQRVLIIRAITDTAGMLRVAQPTWLADLIKAKPAEPATPAKPVTETGVVATSDERWVDARVVELATIKQREQLDQLVTSTAVRTIMARLRRENRPLFDRADEAFTAKHNELPPHEEEG